jgi:trehalose 6-phosphate synthase
MVVARATLPQPAFGPTKSTAERLILVSNRGPVSHNLDESGRIRRNDADGGVATALASIARRQPVTWIAGACSLADRVVSITGQEVRIGEDSYLKLVNLPEEVYGPYYQTLCNPLLWFVQHGIASELQDHDIDDAWLNGYVPANRLFANAVVQELDEFERAPVMLHDYHLYLAPRLIRMARPRAVLQQFVHIPWPQPQAWRALPAEIVRELCDGLLGNDSVVFQTENSVEAFMATCRAYLDGADVCESRGKVKYAGRTTSVWANPIAVDVGEMRALATSAPVQRYHSELLQDEAIKTIVRVDRMDPSKNILRGFEAFDLLLLRKPQLRRKVRFLAYLVPSRAGIPEYDKYSAAVLAKVEEINARHGTEDWTPVTVYHEQNRSKAIAGMQIYDVLLVNSVADGMNLVSKEGPAVNQRDGVLVLSKSAGSHAELAHGALCVDPLDVWGTAEALATALSMPEREKAQRASFVRQAIEHHQLRDWLRHQTSDLSVIRYLRENAVVEI